VTSPSRVLQVAHYLVLYNKTATVLSVSTEHSIGWSLYSTVFEHLHLLILTGTGHTGTKLWNIISEDLAVEPGRCSPKWSRAGHRCGMRQTTKVDTVYCDYCTVQFYCTTLYDAVQDTDVWDTADSCTVWNRILYSKEAHFDKFDVSESRTSHESNGDLHVLVRVQDLLYCTVHCTKCWNARYCSVHCTQRALNLQYRILCFVMVFSPKTDFYSKPAATLEKLSGTLLYWHNTGHCITKRCTVQDSTVMYPPTCPRKAVQNSFTVRGLKISI
jgi:hypothetical protein